VGVFATSGNAGTIQFVATPSGPNAYFYSFSISGFDLLTNEAIDIRFDPSIFLSLSNGFAPNTFHLAVLQPNNPPGAFGDYSALALVDHPSVAGPFTVNAVLQPGAAIPARQPFEIDQFNGSGQLLSVITMGIASEAPEPSSAGLLAAAGILLVASSRILRRT